MPKITCMDFTSEKSLSRPEFAGWREVFEMFGQMKPLDILAFLLAMVPNDRDVYDLLVDACRCMWDTFTIYDDEITYLRVVQ